jgi:GTP:adenosylcobinamide-phosphate guanylyltransferase
VNDGLPQPSPRGLTALVLAGRRGPADPVADAAGLSHKCLVPAAGVPMLARVVEALAASRSVRRIAVSIEDPDVVADLRPLTALRADGRLVVLAGAATPSLSALAAAETLDKPHPFVITTADHALLTPDLVDFFVAAAIETGADIVAGLVPAELVIAAYPRSKRTFLRFRDGSYSSCNLFCVVTDKGLRVLRFWRRVEQDRKRPWRIARAFGIGTLVLYVIGRLTLAQALARLSRVLEVDARAVVVPFAEAAIDVDKPSDLALVEEILGRRDGTGGAKTTPDTTVP